MKTCWGKLTDKNIDEVINEYKANRVETFRSEDGETIVYLTGDALVYLKDFNELKEKYNV